jgi:fructose-1,6-bisphosphatase/inositol monophosphatase family enzyme
VGDEPARRAQVSKVQTLKDAVVTMSTPRTPFQITEKDGVRQHERVTKLLAAPRDVRGWGDCHAHMMVATGRLEAMINGKIGRWDVAPLEPIVLEAGGTITDWNGDPAADGKLGAVTSNGAIHGELIALLRA